MKLFRTKSDRIAAVVGAIVFGVSSASFSNPAIGYFVVVIVATILAFIIATALIAAVMIWIDRGAKE